MSETVDQLTAHLFREFSGKMAAVLVKRFDVAQLDIIMDVIQDTFEAALNGWKFSGVPSEPEAWLMKVSKNKMVNALKRKRFETPLEFHKEYRDDSIEEVIVSPNEMADSQLRLLVACCHDGLSVQNQIIITLYILCGFGIPEIANALQMNSEAVKKALTRSKKYLKTRSDLFDEKNLIDDHISLVHTILYLMFNEGYKTTRAPDAIDHALCFEAIRLTRLIHELNMASTRETKALLALMFLNISRFDVRYDDDGVSLSLDEQDRSGWNRVYIEEGLHYLREATTGNEISRYHIEALISSFHCIAEDASSTNWRQISFLYGELEKLEPESTQIKINKIIAESYFTEAEITLNRLNSLSSENNEKVKYLVLVTKGELLRRWGRKQEAFAAFHKAMQIINTPIDARYISKRMLQCLE